MRRGVTNTALVAKIAARIATPTEQRLYAGRVERRLNPPPCRYGHLGCALTEGGPCMNEVLTAIGMRASRAPRAAS
jgi:hypothetical protein